MLTEKINELRAKLESQILNNEPYDNIYSTSLQIDKLLTEYYKNQQLAKKT